MDNPTIERAGRLFAALANPSRLRIAELLCRTEMHTGLSVGEICSALSLRQSGTSQNLAELAHAGVLSVENRGTHRIYKMRGPRIGAILELIEEFCEVHALYGIPLTSAATTDPTMISDTLTPETNAAGIDE